MPIAVRPALAALAAVFVCLPQAASAQVLGQTPYVAQPDPVVERLQTKVDNLEVELRAATGKAEQLAFQLNEANKKAEAANAGRLELEAVVNALSARIAALEAHARGETEELASAAPTGALGPTGAPQEFLTLPSRDNGASGPADAPPGLASRITVSELPTDETELLRQSRELLLSGNYPAAQEALGVYLQLHPRSPQADSAQYLYGESLLYQENYADAATAYGKLLSDYPKSDRGPEALVKLARSMRLMGKKSEACQALGLMNNQFPRASQTAKTLAATERSRAGC